MAVQTDAATLAYHLDELSTRVVTETIIPRITELPYNSSTTLFLFSSPQFIAETESFKAALLDCERMVAIDKAHLYAMHSRSFRVQICQLLPDLFKIIFAHDKQQCTLCLVMTAMNCTIPSMR